MTDVLISLFQDIFSPLFVSLSWINFIEIGVIVAVCLVFYRKFIKNTQSEKLFKGLFFLVGAWIISEILILINLRILGVFLRTLVALISLSLIVIFQPELRRFLGYLGQPGFIKRILFGPSSYSETAKQDVDYTGQEKLMEMYVPKTSLIEGKYTIQVIADGHEIGSRSVEMEK